MAGGERHPFGKCENCKFAVYVKEGSDGTAGLECHQDPRTINSLNPVSSPSICGSSDFQTEDHDTISHLALASVLTSGGVTTSANIIYINTMKLQIWRVLRDWVVVPRLIPHVDVSGADQNACKCLKGHDKGPRVTGPQVSLMGLARHLTSTALEFTGPKRWPGTELRYQTPNGWFVAEARPCLEGKVAAPGGRQHS
eukprot:g1730.t1